MFNKGITMEIMYTKFQLCKKYFPHRVGKILNNFKIECSKQLLTKEKNWDKYRNEFVIQEGTTQFGSSI